MIRKHPLAPDLSFPDPFFSVDNGTFLHETESFVVSAETLSQVCRESRAAVRVFHGRYGRLQSQRGFFFSDALFSLSPGLSVPIRSHGPYAVIFHWHDFRLLEREGITSWSVASYDLGLVRRWLVPIDTLIRDLHEMEVAWDTQFWSLPLISGHSCVKYPLLGPREHDLIALVPANSSPTPLRYSDLIIVSAPASRDMVIPGLEAGDRDFLLQKFAHCKESLGLFEEQWLSPPHGPFDLPEHERVFPDLYFAYVDPLKRSKQRQIMNEQAKGKDSPWRRLLGLIL